MMDSDAINTLRETLSVDAQVKTFGEADAHGVLLIPERFKAEDLRKFLPPPAYIKAKLDTDTAQSFVDYVTVFGDDASCVFANEQQRKWVAILDYHEPAARAECAHYAVFTAGFTFEATEWLNNHGKRMDHAGFVRFLEDRAKEVTSMPAGQIFDLVRSLDIRSDATFSSEISLHNGQVRLAYEETVRGGNKPGTVEIPREFQISLPLFDGLQPRTLLCRLRYQVKEQKLALWYDIADKDREVLEATRAVTVFLRARLTKAQFYTGSVNPQT